ncbi:ABC transporter permease subunit [Deinococcus yavapaiensis]|uniref:ABC-2 type transport system permease protein n=1 Tax=Deinococcus yavapaiensis KR-236 TaxID=694435 RepID=A0A318SMN9_9DEIO|nr:ABC transporter permease subunit [Deinococcus yavapaiensis]PYE55943.1 ABC-2 type transport system permease protein [Deinococcus yavapaiensis KR-236]
MWLEVLRDRVATTWRSTLGWAVGLSAFVLMNWMFYPLVRDSPDITRLLERLPQTFRTAFGADDFISPGGYAWARSFSLLLPLTLSIYAINFGARAIARDEQEGRLELLFAQPVSRLGVLSGRTLALAVNLALLGLSVGVISWLGALLVGAKLDAGALLAATAQVTLLAWTFGALALAVGAATGRAALASGVAFAVTLAGYLVHSLAPQVRALRDVREFTPFWYAVGENPFLSGAHAVNSLVLLGAGCVLVALATAPFARRDLAK